MFSGKTTELIRRIESVPSDAQVMCFKPAIEDRYSRSNIVSHDGKVLSAHAAASPRDILDRSASAEVIGVDEIHFFDDSIVAVFEQLAARGVRVVAAGLDRDMWGDAFAHVQRIAALARTTEMFGICAVCRCQADRTHRTAPLVDDNLVGGAESFEPRCQNCFKPPPTPKPTTAHPGLAGQ